LNTNTSASAAEGRESVFSVVLRKDESGYPESRIVDFSQLIL
jgi:hypothetical protein